MAAVDDGLDSEVVIKGVSLRDEQNIFLAKAVEQTDFKLCEEIQNYIDAIDNTYIPLEVQLKDAIEGKQFKVCHALKFQMNEFPKSLQEFQNKQKHGSSSFPIAEAIASNEESIIINNSHALQHAELLPEHAEIIPQIDLSQAVEMTSFSASSSSSSGQLEALDLRTLKLDDPINLRNFLTEPLQQNIKPIQCSLKAYKPSMFSSHWEYKLYTNIPINERGDSRELFLLKARKQSGIMSTNSIHCISMNENEIPSKNSQDFLGSVEGNFIGTEYTVYNSNTSRSGTVASIDKDAGGKGGSHSNEIGGIKYDLNVLGVRGPRRLQIGIPFDEKGQQPNIWTNYDSIIPTMKAGDFSELFTAENKDPVWNELTGSFVLNFGGRVTLASAKNFVLPLRKNHTENLLLFGKVGEGMYSMDVAPPLSLLQAFGFAVAGCDRKIGCE